jgi:serine protease Do
MNKIGYRIVSCAIALALLQGASWGTSAKASVGTSGEVSARTVGPVRTMVSADSSDGRYTDYASGAIPKAIQQTSPSVVAIIGKHSADGEEAGRFDLSHGTGVIIKSNGTIITNAHVVKDMEHIVVVTYDGKQYSGRTTHLDEESDLALVRIEATGLKEAVFAPKADTLVGETVIAIGTPISFSLRNSVTVGVISGLDRSLNSTYRLLQTDAAINPGNSGGALVNLKGEVVGINTLKFTDYGIDNLGFAIPVDTVQYVLKHFEAYGKVKRPSVGIELEESWAAVVGIPTDEPLTVSFVEPGSPADKAGMKADDKLLAVGTNNIRTLVEFNELLKAYLPGQSAEFTLQSGGQNVKRTVVFGELAQTGSSQAERKDAEEAFDTDAGKTRIGDSEYGWSMKYPSGAAKFYQSKKGNTVTLGDAKGEYSLYVTVEEQQNEYSKSALLKELASQEEGGIILDRKYVDGKNGSYARVISKDDYGFYESRAYLHGDYIYFVALAIHEEQDYKNITKRKGFTDLLDSFSPSFDVKDPALKDIAVKQDGYQRFIHEDYGYSFSVPAEWSADDYDNEARFTDRGGSRHAEVYMASMAEGDSLQKWADRMRSIMEARYASGYIESGAVTDAKVAGLSGKEWTVSVREHDKWNTTTYYFVEKDGYKYRLEIGYPKDTAAKETEQLVSRVRASFELGEGNRNEALGYMEDEEDLVDYSNTLEFRNRTLGYTLEVPEFWERNGFSGSDYGEEGSDFTSFRFIGGSFSIIGSSEETYEDTLKELEKRHKESAEKDSDYKVETTDEEVFGTAAKKFTVHYKTKKKAYETTQYMFQIGEVCYVVSMELDDAARTEINIKDMQKAFESMGFKKD